MKRYYVPITLLSLTLIVGSCKKDDSTPVTPTPQTKAIANEYFIPMQAGKQIKLGGRYIATQNGFPIASDTVVVTFTVQASTKKSTGGKTLNVVFSSITGPVAQDDTLYIYSGDSEVLSFDSTLAEANAETLLKVPLEVGASWKTRAADISIAKVLSTTDSVGAAIGKFINVLRIYSNEVRIDIAQGGESEYYYAKGVGPVRQTTKVKVTFAGFTLDVTVDVNLLSKNY